MRSENVPVVPVNVPNQPDLNRVEPVAFDPINSATEDVDEVLPVGLIAMDRGMKEFFQDIEVPTKDGNRKLEVRIAGGDKTVLFWKQLMDQDNRIKLPVMSINQTGCQLNTERHTPASPGHYFYRRFADGDGTRMVLTPREYSLYIDYTLSVWTERKRDAEYIRFQILSRFNPLAEWTTEDEYMVGNMIASFEGMSDNTDLDIDANQLAKVRYDYNIKVEGWMPLPGRIVPTVLGRVTDLSEQTTREFFQVIDP